MGKGDRNNSATRSHSQRDKETQLSHNIPAIFRSQQQATQLSSQDSALTTRSATYSLDRDRDRYNLPAHTPAASQTPLCLGGMQSKALDIKNTLSANIADLRIDIQSVAIRQEGVEAATSRQESAIAQIQQVSDTHSLQLRKLHRHLEDLDNKGRRHNIKVRGLTEAVEPGYVHQCVQSLIQ